jgi:hypothetical protein
MRESVKRFTMKAQMDAATSRRLAVAFIAVNVTDVLTTAVALRRGHREGNPFMAAIMRKRGVRAAMALKMGLAMLMAGSLHRMRRADLLVVPSLLLGAVSLSNAWVAQRPPKQRRGGGAAGG